MKNELKTRGWFPQEPHLHTQQTTPKTKTQTITNTLGSYSPAVIVIGIVCWFAVLSDSWIQIAGFIGTAVVFAAYVLSRRNLSLRRVIRNTWTIAMVCIIVFTAVETYMFWNAGYPPTYSQADPKTTLTMQSMLNASLLQIIQNIEQSPTFSLLKMEHGEFEFYSLQFTPTDVGGYLEVNFFCEGDSTYAHFFSGNGNQYRLTAGHSDLIFPYIQPSNFTQQSLRQIDQVGLRGFYDQAIELANNKTANLSLIDTLDINIGYRSSEWVVQVIGHHNDGSIFGEDVIVSSFQPNGKLIGIHTLEAPV
jgi:hypothetical protein